MSESRGYARQFIWKDWPPNQKVMLKQSPSRVLECKISWKAAPQDLQLLIRYYWLWFSGFSPCVPPALLKFVVSCITSSLLFYFFGETSGLNDLLFFLTPNNTQSLPGSLSSLSSSWKHHTTLAEDIRWLRDLNGPTEQVWRLAHHSYLKTMKFNHLRGFTTSLWIGFTFKSNICFWLLLI